MSELVQIYANKELHDRWVALAELDVVISIEGGASVDSDYQTTKETLNDWYKHIGERNMHLYEEGKDVLVINKLLKETLEYLLSCVKNNGVVEPVSDEKSESTKVSESIKVSETSKKKEGKKVKADDVVWA